MRLHLRFSSLSIALVAACGVAPEPVGDDAGTTTTVDAGTTTDVDAGTIVDAGVATDAGISTDAGTAPDAGTVTDGGEPVNHPPVIRGTPPTRTNEDAPFTFTFVVEDADSDPVTVHAAGVPAWASFDGTTRTLTGTPTNDDVGTSRELLITAEDNHAGITSAGPFELEVANVNDAPTITNAPPERLEAGEEFSFVPTVVDPDTKHGDHAKYSMTGTLPGWLAFDAGTGGLRGTPPPVAIDHEFGPFSITVTDDALAAVSVGPFTLQVFRQNVAPTIAGSPASRTLEDAPFSFRPEVFDPDVSEFGDQLTFRIDHAPAWATFDPTTGQLSGAPGNGDVGVTEGIVITVRDAFGEEAHIGPFTITVENVNDAPTITGSAPGQATEGLAYTFTPVAADVDSTGLVFSISGNPAWLRVDASTGALSGTPGARDGGDTRYDVVLVVTDPAGASASLAFALTVTIVNDPPVMAAATSVTVAQGVALAFDLGISDPDGGPVTNLRLESNPAWISLISAGGGKLTGTPGNADVGAKPVVVVAVDEGGAVLRATITVTVTNVNDPPRIANTPAPKLVVGTPYRHDFGVTDPDTIHGDVVTCSLSGSPPSWITINTSTCVLDATPPTGSGSTRFGPYTLTANDGKTTATMVFTFDIIATNNAPTLSGTPGTTVNEDATYTFRPVASDPDSGDTLTFNITNRPSWATFSTTTGELTGTPVDANVGVTSGVVIGVVDSAGSSKTLPAFNLTVVNTNDAPRLSGTPTTEVNERVAYRFDPVSSDDDLDSGDVLTFSATGLPSWLALNTSTGVLTGTPQPANIGVSTITLTVKDSANASVAIGPFTLTVRNVNEAPQLSGSPATTIDEDQPYAFQPGVSDPDVGDVLTFSFSGLPAWLSGDTTTGKLTGTPGDADPGVYQAISISVRDAGGLTASLPPFTLTVRNVNDAPVLTGTPPTQVNEDGTYSFSPEATDADRNDTRAFSITGKPTWATFSTTTGALSGVPANADVGTVNGITIKVMDAAGASSTIGPFAIEVVNVNDAPTISGSPGVAVDEDAPYAFTPQASDVDVGAQLTFAISNKPAWATFDTTNGKLSGTPVNADVGTTSGIIISVTDGLAAAVPLPAFNLQVRNVNDAPVISGSPATSAAAGIPYSFIPTASDVDPGPDTLVFAITNKPSWATFNTTIGMLSGTPSAGNAGTTSGILISVSDGKGGTAALPAFSITVTTKVPPLVAESPRNLTTTEDIAYLLIKLDNVTDPDGTTASLVVSEVASPPAHGTLQTSTGGALTTPVTLNAFIRYKPAANYSGQDSFVLRWKDSDGLTSDQIFELGISATNDAPTCDALSITVPEDTPTDFTLTGADVDGLPPTVTIVWSGPTNGAVFDGTVPTNTTWPGKKLPATLRFAPAPNYNGSDSFVYTACDSGGLCCGANVNVTITPQNDAPDLINPPAKLWGEAGMPFAYAPIVNDPDGPSLSFSLAPGSAALPSGFALNATTGVISKSIAIDQAPGVLATGLKLQVTDGIGTDVSSPFSIAISRWSRPGGPELLVAEHQIVDLATADLDGDGLKDVVGVEDVSGDIVIWRQETAAPGRFRAPIRISPPDKAEHVALRNMNQDVAAGKTMIDVVAILSNGQVAIFLQKTGLAFAFAPPILVDTVASDRRFAKRMIVATKGADTDNVPDIITVVGGIVRLIDCDKPTASTFSCALNTLFSRGVNVANIATGDLNGDGLPDLALVERVNGNTEASWLYGEFSAGSYARGGVRGGPLGEELVVVNVNGTEAGGPYDDVVATGRHLNVLYGKGSATNPTTWSNDVELTARTTLIGQTPWDAGDLAVADVTGDGVVDAIFSIPEEGGIGILPGALSGTTFTWKTTTHAFLKTPPNPSSLEVGDLDGDTFPDLVVAFASDASAAHMMVPYGVAVAFGSAAAWTTNPSTVFGAPHRIDVEQAGHTTLRIGDLKKADTLTPDLLLCGGARTVGATTGNFTVAFQQANVAGRRTGWYEPALAQNYLDVPLGVRATSDCRIADINGDGRADVVTGHSYSGSESGPAVQLFTSLNTSGGYSPPVKFSSGLVRAPRLWVGDFSGDGKPDVATLVSTSGSTGSPPLLLRNGAAGTLSPFTGPSTGTQSFLGGPTFATLTGGALPDMMLVTSTGGVDVYPQAQGGTWGTVVKSTSLGINGGWSALADVNQDGVLDYIGFVDPFGTNETNWVNGGLQVALGDASRPGGFLPANVAVRGPIGSPQDAEVLDLNGDLLPDVVVADDLGVVAVFLADGANAGKFRPPVVFAAAASDARSAGLTVGDVDGDGVKDILFASEREAIIVEFLSTLAK